MPHDQAREVIAELVEALREIDPKHRAVTVGLSWLIRHEVEVVSSLPGWVKKKHCYNCSAEIFFAARQHATKNASQIWIPMVPASITSDRVVLDAVSLRFVGHDVFIEDPQPGVQWIPHRVLCGMTSAPDDPEMADIWRRTVGKALEEEEVAVASLLATLGETE